MGRILVALFVGVCLGVLGDLCLGSAQVGGYGWRVNNSSVVYGRPAYQQPQRNYNTSLNYQKNYNASWNRPTNYSTGWNGRRYPRSIPISGITKNGTHSFYWGTYSPYDRLLYSSRVAKDRSFLRKVTMDVDFPTNYQQATGNISYIQVIDQEPVGIGGSATILGGGVGYRSVTIHFKSQRNQPFDFTVNIYGR